MFWYLAKKILWPQYERRLIQNLKFCLKRRIYTPKCISIPEGRRPGPKRRRWDHRFKQKCSYVKELIRYRPFVILNNVANEISSNGMEEAAVNVFGFTRKEIRIQRRLAKHQAMFQLLCSWWRIQQGSDSAKRCKLLEKLTFAQERGLLRKAAFNHFRDVLNNMEDCPNFANLSIPRGQGKSGRSSTSSDSENEATILMPNPASDTVNQPSRLISIVQWIWMQIVSLFSFSWYRICFQRVRLI